MCDQLPRASTGPITVVYPLPEVRPRHSIRPDSMNNRYWLFTAPAMVFSNTPPYCPATLGLTQASMLNAPGRSKALAAGKLTAPAPAKLAALSPGTAPATSSVRSLYVPLCVPTASAAVVAPSGSPRRQYPAG